MNSTSGEVHTKFPHSVDWKAMNDAESRIRSVFFTPAVRNSYREMRVLRPYRIYHGYSIHWYCFTFQDLLQLILLAKATPPDGTFLLYFFQLSSSKTRRRRANAQLISRHPLQHFARLVGCPGPLVKACETGQHGWQGTCLTCPVRDANETDSIVAGCVCRSRNGKWYIAAEYPLGMDRQLSTSWCVMHDAEDMTPLEESQA